MKKKEMKKKEEVIDKLDCNILKSKLPKFYRLIQVLKKIWNRNRETQIVCCVKTFLPYIPM